MRRINSKCEGDAGDVPRAEAEHGAGGAVAGSRGWAKSFLKIPYPLKIFVLMYKNILIYKSF